MFKQQYTSPAGYKYNYIGSDNDNPNESHEYNPAIYDNFIAQRNYEGAVEYLRKFQYLDLKQQSEFNARINEVELQGRIKGKVYENLDEKQKALVSFSDNFENNTLNNLVNPNNEFATKEELDVFKTFSKYKDNLYSDGENKSSKIRITFEGKQRKLFGIFDRLKHDAPEASIDTFYRYSGLSEGILRQNGVKVDLIDGKTIIEFDKDKAIANQILYNASLYKKRGPREDEYYSYKIEGLDDKGNVLNDNSQSVFDVINTFMRLKNRPFTTIYLDRKNNSELAFVNFIEKANEVKQNAYDNQYNGDDGMKQYSSTVGRLINDEIYALEDAKNNGTITEQQYKAERKALTSELDEFISTVSIADLHMYSDKNQEDGVEVLEELDQADRLAIKKFLSNEEVDCYYNTMINDGQIGLLVWTKPHGVEKKGWLETDEEKLYRKGVQVFIPSNGARIFDKIQQKINEDTNCQSAMLVNKMQDWNFDYKLEDGSVLYNYGEGKFGLTSRDGQVNTNNKIVDLNEAQKLIHKNIIMRDLSQFLKYKHINIYDTFQFNSNNPNKGIEEYDKEALDQAFMAATELNPGALTDARGLPLWNLQDLFNSDKLHDIITDSTPEQYIALSDFFDIYNKVMKQVEPYRPNYSYTQINLGR